DDKLKEISRSPGIVTQFDPRVRPWYQQATDTPHATKPYLFYDSKVVGLTAMSKTAAPGVVVVFDITLANLSKTIAKHQVTPSSEVVLINTDGQTLAYKDQKKIVVESEDSSNSNKVKLANLKQLDSGVLAHLSTFVEKKEQDFDFEYSGQRWIGSARVVAKTGGVDLYALMLTPVDELLVDAVAIREQLIFIALIVLLMFIPVIWYTAQRISTPLHVLSKEAEAISRFDFDETKQKTSFIKEVDELDSAMTLMKSTINKFIKLINSLAGEQDLDALLKIITQETMLVSKSDAALIYLMDEQDDLLKADFLCDKDSQQVTTMTLPALNIESAESILDDK
ncbi:MAG: cache domain-containing protein, partial [Gammaproteobacteria bacterium]|nr:cache domain-containing protein [Gammaproteobacteria bacterium]